MTGTVVGLDDGGGHLAEHVTISDDAVTGTVVGLDGGGHLAEDVTISDDAVTGTVVGLDDGGGHLAEHVTMSDDAVTGTVVGLDDGGHLAEHIRISDDAVTDTAVLSRDVCDNVCSDSYAREIAASGPSLDVEGRSVDGIDAAVSTGRSKRQYDELLSCFFCGKLLKMKMRRHLTGVHRKEPEIVRIMKLGSEERERELARIRNHGNFIHNTSVLENGKGSLICARKIKRHVSPRKYLPCVHCLSMVLSKDLYSHTRKCKLRSDSAVQSSVKSRSRFFLQGAVKAKGVHVSSKFKCEILDSMHCDGIAKICRKDDMILRFGLSLHQKLGRRRSHDISQRMRQLARLMDKVNSDRAQRVHLSECLSGRMFDCVVLATLSLCGSFDDPSGRPLFHNPSLGLKLGHSLVKCAEVKKGIAIRKGDTVLAKEAEDFLTLHKAEWTNRVSSAALASMKNR